MRALLLLLMAMSCAAQGDDSESDPKACAAALVKMLQQCAQDLPASENAVSFSPCVNSKDPRLLKGCTRENYQNAAIAARAQFEDNGGTVAEESIFNEPRSIFYRIFQDKNADMQTRIKWATFLLQSYFGDYLHVLVVGFAFFIFSIRSSLNETKKAVAELRRSNKALRASTTQMLERVNQITTNHCRLDDEVSSLQKDVASLQTLLQAPSAGGPVGVGLDENGLRRRK